MRGPNVGTPPKGLDRRWGLYPFRRVHIKMESRMLARCGWFHSPADCPQLRCGSLLCHGHSSLPRQWLLGRAADLYLTSQALGSTTDLPAGSSPHMLHVTEAEATRPRSPHAVMEPEIHVHPHLHGKGCLPQGGRWEGGLSLGTCLTRVDRHRSTVGATCFCHSDLISHFVLGVHAVLPSLSCSEELWAVPPEGPGSGRQGLNSFSDSP